MSRFARPDPSPDEPAPPDPPSPEVEDASSSEFMSEDSPEVRAMWAPQVKIAGPALEQPSVGDLGDSVSDAPAVDPAAVELRTFPAAARKLAAVEPRRSPLAMPGDASDVVL